MCKKTHGQLPTKADSYSENEEYHMVVFDSSIVRERYTLDEVVLLFFTMSIRQLT